MVDDLGRLAENPLRHALQRAFVGFRIRPRLDLLGEEGARDVELFGRVVDAVRRRHQHVANGLPEAGAGQRVEADEGEPARPETLADDAHQRRTDSVGRPGVDAMGDDIVEVAEPGADIGEVEGVEGGVRRAALHRRRPGARDRRLVDVDPDEFRAGAAIAMAMRLTPSPQPMSRTRAAPMGATSRPSKVAIAPIAAGWV